VALVDQAERAEVALAALPSVALVEAVVGRFPKSIKAVLRLPARHRLRAAMVETALMQRAEVASVALAEMAATAGLQCKT
jgi:hypothetical protein